MSKHKKLTRKQQLDLDTVMLFIPENVKFDPITDEDISIYFEWSDQGKHKELVKNSRFRHAGLSALVWGKTYRDLQVQEYLSDWGETCTSADFADEPEYYVEWLSKVMKKRAIYTMWRLCNKSEELDETDDQLLQPLKVYFGNA